MEPERIAMTRRSIDLSKYKARHAEEDDAIQRLSKPTIIEENGKPVIAMLHAEGDWARLRQALQEVAYRVDYRSGAMLTRARTFGHLPRLTIRREWCTAATLRHEAPGLDAELCNIAPALDSAYRLLRPDVYALHAAEAAKVSMDYRIEKTVFTSGIVNHNNPLPYHHDAGNVKGAWSAMLVFRDGVEGGGLVVPEFDSVFELPDASLLIFDGSSLLHGVSPIKKVKPNGYRYSIVYYTMASMWKCLPPDEELRRVRKLRTERERNRAKNLPTGKNRAKGASPSPA